MHDHDVRRMHLSEEDARDQSASLQGYLYVDGRVARRDRRRRNARVAGATVLLGAAFAVGYASFRYTQFNHDADVVAPLAQTTPQAARVAAYLATAPPQISLPHSQFLPAMPVQQSSAAPSVTPHDVLNLPSRVRPVAVVAHKHAQPAKPRRAIVQRPQLRVAKPRVVALVTRTPAPARTPEPLRTPASTPFAAAPTPAPTATTPTPIPSSAAPTPVAIVTTTPARVAGLADARRQRAEHAHAAHERALQLRHDRAIKQHEARLQAQLVLRRRHEQQVALAQSQVFVAPAPHAVHAHRRHLVAAGPPQILRFSAQPETIAAGGGSTICVAARHASQLSVSMLGEFHAGGLACRRVTPTQTTTYTAWAVNKRGQTISDDVTVTVAQ